MIYAKRVRSSLKGGVDVELGPKTVLCGRNGAGKTAVLQALKLGTRGYVDDQEGKDGVSTTAAIARLFPEGSELKAEVEMSDGTSFTWSSKPQGKGYTKPKATGKERPYKVDFPFHTVKALLSGDEKKIRAWLEQQTGSNFTVEDLMAMLPPAQHKDADPILKRFSERSPVELATALKGEARNLRASATRTEKTIDQLVEGIPLPLSDVEAERLSGRKAELWAQANRPDLMSPAQHAALRTVIEELAESLGMVKTQIDGLPEAQEGEEETFKLASQSHALSKAHLEQLGHDVCYVCLRKDADVQGAFNRWAGVLGDLQAAGSRKRLQSQYDRGMAEAGVLAKKYTSAQVMDSSPVIDEHSSISASLASHEANKRIWKQAEGLRKEVASSRAVADTCTSLARTWEEEGKAILLRRKKDFEDKVTAFLPAGETFVVDLAAGRVGLGREGATHTSLSGAEMSRVLLAVLSAEEAGSTPSILEPEDRGWDPDTLADVMTALTDSPDQVILMSTVPPARSPEGWNVIHVGD